MKLLTFTTLYPNAAQPSHGIFVENRIAHLVESGHAETTVVAPVPCVPNVRVLPERYRPLGEVPRREARRGIPIHHPRYFLLPKVSMLAAPISLYAAAKRCVTAIIAAGYEFDLIDAHYFYPDGVAAILLGRHFKKPVVITARGSDITLLSQFWATKKMIQWAASEAAGIITVCQSLKDSFVALGASAEKIRVLRNGVDLTLFRPAARDLLRRRLGLTGTTLLSVGLLIPRKSHDLAIRALTHLSDGATTLIIIGDGPEERSLRSLAAERGLANRVRFLGSLPHHTLAEYYSAADVLLLLSSREGWANVLLEAMACGTPVVATAVGGTPEVVTTPTVGELVKERTPATIAHAIESVLARRPDRQGIRAYAEAFSWDATTKGQLDLFSEILQSRRQGGPEAVANPTPSDLPESHCSQV